MARARRRYRASRSRTRPRPSPADPLPRPFRTPASRTALPAPVRSNRPAQIDNAAGTSEPDAPRPSRPRESLPVRPRRPRRDATRRRQAPEAAIDSNLTIRRRKVSDDVKDALLGMMRRGELRDGDRLPPERALAARFGVSRTTLRDAIRELELLGYLHVRQGGGTAVRTPGPEALSAPFRSLLQATPQHAEDLMQFRRMLEPEVAALAAHHCRPEDAAGLRTAVARQRRLAEARQPLLDADLDFHRLVARVAGNTTVLHVLNTLQTLLREFRSHMITADRPMLAVDQHASIAEAIIAGEAEAARSAVLAHLEAVERSIVRRPGLGPEGG